MIFFMKGKNETHDSMQTTNAPISLNDLVPTIVEAIGEDYTPYGQSVHDFSADESRERSVYIRVRDDAYPAVKRFDGVTEGGMNAYHVYTYYGTLKDLVFLYDNGYYTPVQVIDSYF
jgi:arylsulfatase A-like enzyme